MINFNKYHFIGQKPGEEILLMVRRHWFNILSQFFVIFLMAILLIALAIYLPVLFPELRRQLAQNFLSFLENSFFMLIWITFFVIWIDYYFDVWIVTNERVVNIEQKGLFSRVTSELELEKIQDITTDVRGVIPTFLNYGDLFIQTAGERQRFVFRQVPNPYKIKDLIMNLQEKMEDKEENEFGELIKKKVHEETV